MAAILKNTNPSLTFDQRRREIRRELFIQRQADRDNTEARLFSDARKLDAQLKSEGFKLERETEWSRNRCAKFSPSSSEVDVPNCFPVAIDSDAYSFI